MARGTSRFRLPILSIAAGAIVTAGVVSCVDAPSLGAAAGDGGPPPDATADASLGGDARADASVDDARKDADASADDARKDADASVQADAPAESDAPSPGDAGDAGGDGATSGDATSGDATPADASDGASPARVAAIHGGCYSSIFYVVYSDGRLKAFGDNSYGALGIGSGDLGRGYAPNQMGTNLAFVNLGTGRTVREVAGGAYASCARLDDGSVKCWGYNIYGELGLGDTIDRGAAPGDMGDQLPAVRLGTGRTATSIAMGISHACALLDDATVKCWGANDSGQLGLGDPDPRGDGPNEMGDALPAVALGTARTAKAVFAGDNHSCALLDDDSLKCWGYNDFGQLGLGDLDNRGDDPSEMGDALPAIDVGAGRHAVSVALGRSRTCALLDDASVKCWGRNAEGQLGNETAVDRGYHAGDMGAALPRSSLGTGKTALALARGDDSTCVILNDRSVKCWGVGANGQLGSGATANVGGQTGQMGDALPIVALGTGRTAKMLAGNGGSWCALLDDDGVKCWGNAGLGLGYGNTNDVGDGSNEMGDFLPEIDLTP